MFKKSSVIAAAALSKFYASEGKKIAALHEVGFSVEPGDIYGIIGASGAGKSTLLRSLAGLIQPSSGQVLFHGDDIHKMHKKEKRRFQQKIGMIFQHFNLLSSRTAAENIAFPLEICGKQGENSRVEELLGLVGLLEKKDVYPAFLSGGEKQRVGIARALAGDPEVLFCDEATSALDPRTTKEILDLLKRVNVELGVTIILITHDMEVIKRICNKVAVLEKGRVVEEGLITEVFADPQHAVTKRFIQSTSHEIPKEFLKPASPNRKLLRLRFKGHAAGEPLISLIAKKYQVEANILLGWIDRLQTLAIGTLVIELTGSAEGLEGALAFLAEKGVHVEVLDNAS